MPVMSHHNLRIAPDQYTGQKVVDQQFRACDFSGADLTATEFVNCSFFDAETRTGCRFNGAVLKDASFRQCDISMCSFNFIKGLGLEISECRAQGADFSSASFMNQITTRTWFCSAYIKKSNLRYANFSRVTLEKCELWENRWEGANVSGASFAGSDLSGGQFDGIDWQSANFTDCDLTNSELGGAGPAHHQSAGSKAGCAAGSAADAAHGDYGGAVARWGEVSDQS